MDKAKKKQYEITNVRIKIKLFLQEDRTGQWEEVRQTRHMQRDSSYFKIIEDKAGELGDLIQDFPM